MEKEITEKDLVSILKTGDFTIVYWNAGEPTFYRGKWNISKEYDKDEYATMNKSQLNIAQYNMNGYLPDNELAFSKEKSIYCDFCGGEDVEVFTSSFDDRKDGDERKCETQICLSCVRQLAKFLPS